MKIKKYTRKVSRTGAGRSVNIVIPSEIAAELKLKEHQKMKLFKSGRKIIIEDWKE